MDSSRIQEWIRQSTSAAMDGTPREIEGDGVPAVVCET